REFDFQYHGRDFVARPLEHAGAVAEAQLVARHPAHLAAAAIQYADPRDGVGHLRPVGPDVLHGGGAGRPGDARQALQPAQPVRDGGHPPAAPPRPPSARTTLPSTVTASLASRTAVRSPNVSAMTRLEPPANTSTGPRRVTSASESSRRKTATTCSV